MADPADLFPEAPAGHVEHDGDRGAGRIAQTTVGESLRGVVSACAPFTVTTT